METNTSKKVKKVKKTKASPIDRRLKTIENDIYYIKSELEKIRFSMQDQVAYIQKMGRDLNNEIVQIRFNHQHPTLVDKIETNTREVTKLATWVFELREIFKGQNDYHVLKNALNTVKEVVGGIGNSIV